MPRSVLWMVRIACAAVMAAGLAAPVAAQQRGGPGPRSDGDARRPAEPMQLPADSVTHHTLTLPGRTLQFTATAGSFRTLDAQGAPQFDIAYIADTLDGADHTARPVTFVVNGGPGASSAWLNLGAVGPWRLPIGDATLAPSTPPIVGPNAETWLDFTDLVFIDPVGTGFSRFDATGEDLRKRVWSVEGDIDVLAGTVRRWLARSGRTTSPIFVLGESYGGFRGPRLVRALQTGQGIGVEGLILVSPLLDYGGRSGAFDPMNWVTHLPSMTAVARERTAPVDRAGLADVEAYASGDYLLDLVRGLQDKQAVERITARVAAFTGLDPALVRERAGRIDDNTFVRELHRNDAEVGSYYDGAALAPDPFPEAAFSNHPDLVFDGLRAPLTSAMLDIYSRELKWLPDLPYEVMNVSVARAWDLGRNGRPESASQLRGALGLDRRLRVLIAHGIFDLVTPYFATQIILNQFPPGIGGERVRLLVLPGGHMVYARDASRQALRDAAKALYPE